MLFKVSSLYPRLLPQIPLDFSPVCLLFSYSGKPVFSTSLGVFLCHVVASDSLPLFVGVKLGLIASPQTCGVGFLSNLGGF